MKYKSYLLILAVLAVCVAASGCQRWSTPYGDVKSQDQNKPQYSDDLDPKKATEFKPVAPPAK